VLSALVEFEQTLESLTMNLADPRLGTQINFNNPALQGALASLRASPLLQPAHPDIYVDFIQGIDAADLEAPLSRVELRGQVEGDLKTWFLEIFNDRKPILKLHSGEELLLFAQFVLQLANGKPLGRVLKALRLPALSDVGNLVQEARSQQNIFSTLLHDTRTFLEESFRMPMDSVGR
jgi:hypothetical protein